MLGPNLTASSFQIGSWIWAHFIKICPYFFYILQIIKLPRPLFYYWSLYWLYFVTIFLVSALYFQLYYVHFKLKLCHYVTKHELCLSVRKHNDFQLSDNILNNMNHECYKFKRISDLDYHGLNLIGNRLIFPFDLLNFINISFRHYYPEWWNFRYLNIGLY